MADKKQEPELRAHRAEAALREREAEVALLTETGDAVFSLLKLDALFQLIAQRALTLVKARRVLIPVMCANLTEYTYRGGAGADVEEVLGETLPIELGLCGWVWRNKRAWWKGVFEDLPPVEQERWRSQIGRVMLVPLIGRRQLHGGIAAYDKVGGGDFDERDYHLLSMFARHATIAIDNAALFEQLQDANDALEREVVERKRISRQFVYQATHDTLTGLLNRNEFETYLDQLIQEAYRSDARHALLYLDLDQFKVVNDTCGHIAGDEMLRQVGEHLLMSTRKQDMLVRLGGDEFALLLEDCTLDEAKRIADEVRASVRDLRFAWKEHSFPLSISIGMVPITRESGDRVSLLMAADSACYAAKDQGRNRVQVFQEDDNALSLRFGEMQWVPRISRALEQDRFCLFRQAIQRVANPGGPAGHFEVLLRMCDLEDGLIPPGAFIPAAERYGLIGEIDRWVLRKVLAMMQAEAPQDSSSRYSVNISGHSLSEQSFLDFVRRELRQNRVSSERLCFEITETAAIANLTNARRFIKRLKQLGCSFALDDFGSGLSSFSYLKQLPVDYLKIDGQFVRDMMTDSIDYALVEAINRVGHVMGVATIAECVEEERVLAKLEEIGVDYAQGFFLDRPKPWIEDGES